MMLSLDTAYRSFGGEVEASSTPTICRLPDSRRHQLSAIALSKLEKIDLKSMVREYIEGLSTVHSAFRMTTNPKRKSWNERLGNAVKRFRDQFPDESTQALAILPVDTDGHKAGEEVYIAGPITDYLDHMQNKYSTMVNFAKRRVNF